MDFFKQCYEYLDLTFRTKNLHDHYIDENCTPWLFNGYFQKLVFNLKLEMKQIHKKIHKLGGFKNCMYIYLDLTYFNSLKTYIDFGSVKLYGMQNGNMKDFLLILMAIIYIGLGDFSRKISHCSSATAHKHSCKSKPKKCTKIF